ncbi:MAG: amino acid adenylation domain-containing protein [Pseudomonadota bacterium]
MPLNKHSILEDLATVLDIHPDGIGDEDDLVSLGLDSIGIMRLARAWRRKGIDIPYEVLIRRPTLEAWVKASIEHGKPPAPVTTSAAPAHEPDPAPDQPFPLSPMQQAYWIGADARQIRGGVNAHYYLELDGHDLELPRIEHAVRALFDRHEALRTRFLEDGTQQVLAQAPWRGIVVHALDRMDPDSIRDRLLRLRDTLAHRRLRVEAGEVFDVQVSTLPDGAHRLHINIEMLVCDGRSFQILLSELAAVYEHPESILPPPEYSFRRYLQDLTRANADARTRAEAYWRKRLESLPGCPTLPLHRHLSDLEEVRSERRHHYLSSDALRRLTDSVRAMGVTLSATLATLYAEVVGAWSNSPRFLLNLPMFEREELHPDVHRLVGDFTNVLILEVDLSQPASFEQRIRTLQQRILADASNAAYSGVEVLRDLARRDSEAWIVAPVVFTSVIGLGDLFDRSVRDRFGTPVWISSQTPQVWLDCQVMESDGGLLINWDSVADLFPEGVVDAMFAAFVAHVDRLAGAATDIASPASHTLAAIVPADPPAASDERDSDSLLHAGFFARAESTPDRVALRWGNEGTLTYGSLADRALAVASALAKTGIRSGDTVAVVLPRGPDQIVALLGILSAGAAYVPIGIDQPPARRDEVLSLSGAKRAIVATHDGSGQRLPAHVPTLEIGACSSSAPIPQPLPISPDATAYVIFTSGSTGTPKGVEISHRAAVNTIRDINRRFGVGEDDTVLAVSSLEFDLSVYDIFGLLAAGGTVRLLEEGTQKEAAFWLRHLHDDRITVWNSVPALLDMLLAASEVDAEALPLGLALVSGDWVGLDQPGRLRRLAPECRFVALGGATEAAIWSNCFEVNDIDPAWRSIPYGKALSGQAYRVVDWQGRDCPTWVAGELWIGGKGVAIGYRGDATRTRDRFVEYSGERWYRTGDFGRFLPDGSIEFLGRKDGQIKLNGYRVELGEVESALARHPSVAKAVASATSVPPRLIAGVILHQGATPAEETLIAHASALLPAYMVPERIVAIDALPLTRNGKVDRARIAELAAVPAARSAADSAFTTVEATLASVWRSVLQLDGPVGRDDSFFALGGDSLLATRMLAEIRRHFGVEILLRDLLESRNLGQLARTIERQHEAYEEGTI